MKSDISSFADAMHFYQRINYFTENEEKEVEKIQKVLRRA